MQSPDEKRAARLVCLGLALSVVAAYWAVTQCDFIFYDDNEYIFQNVVAKKGITWPGIAWAFTTGYVSNWHPLTWISHMLDFQLFDLNAAGHHSTNVIFHAANAVLLFLLLRKMTGAIWPSAFVAGVFALHPMHVESVAWVSERKDVLSTLFWILSVGAYVFYVQKKNRPNSRAAFFYALSVFLFALGLMAKPMLVTLPFVLLLLDYWPLQRDAIPRARLLLEKVPFLILALASSIITYRIQEQSGAVSSLMVVPFIKRVEGIPVAYVTYLFKFLWPAKLAVLYPYPNIWPWWKVGGSLVLLAALTAWVVSRRRKERYLTVGWLWFLGMLVPVIGLVHIGSEFIADRYTYLSSVGLLIMLAWPVWERAPASGRRIVPAVAGLILAGCFVLTIHQLGFWKNSEVLFQHTIDVTGDNGIIENNLAKVYCMEHRFDDALPHALRGVALIPQFPVVHYNLGAVYLAQGKVADARQEFAEALRESGHAAEAESQYKELLALDPQNRAARTSLAWMLATQPDASLRNGREALDLAHGLQNPDASDPKTLGILAAACAETGDFAQATKAAGEAIALAEGAGDKVLVGALRTQLAAYRAGKPFREYGPH